MKFRWKSIQCFKQLVEDPLADRHTFRSPFSSQRGIISPLLGFSSSNQSRIPPQPPNNSLEPRSNQHSIVSPLCTCVIFFCVLDWTFHSQMSPWTSPFSGTTDQAGTPSDGPLMWRDPNQFAAWDGSAGWEVQVSKRMSITLSFLDSIQIWQPIDG